jgi:hypothetical protein
MPSSDSSRDVVLERLAAEFVERHRKGEHPPLSEYTDRYPDLAGDIRELFPALVQIEQLKPAADRTEAFEPGPAPPTPRSRSVSASTASFARSAGAAWAWSTRPSSSRSAGTSR